MYRSVHLSRSKHVTSFIFCMWEQIQLIYKNSYNCLLYNLVMIERFKIAVIGSAAAGKTRFISKAICAGEMEERKQDSNLQVYKGRKTIFGSSEEISISDFKGQEASNNYITGLKNSRIVIIVFDVSNEQSFQQVAQKWLPLTKNNTEKSMKVVLLANKTDLKFSITKYKIEEFAENNSMRVYECGRHKSAENVFEKILLDYYLERECDKILSVGQKQKKSSEGFFSKIFNLESKQKDFKKKNDEIKRECEKKLVALRLQFNRRNQEFKEKYKKELNNMYQQITMKNLDIDLDKIQKLEDIMEIMAKAITLQITNFKETIDSLKVNQVDMKKKLMDSEHSLEKLTLLQGKLSEEEQNNKLLEIQLSQAINQIQQLEMKVNQKKRQINLTSNKLEDQLQDLKCENKMLKQKNKELMEQIELTQSNLQQLQEKIRSSTEKTKQTTQGPFRGSSWGSIRGSVSECSMMFLDSPMLRNRCINDEEYSFSLVKILENYHNKYFINNQQSYQNMKGCTKIYAFPQNSQKFHQYIIQKQNLLFCFSIASCIYYLFVPELIQYGKNNKNGFLLVENQSGLQEYINEDSRMFKYSMTQLLFGNQEIIVKIMRNGCSMTLRQKQISFIKNKRDLASVMNLEEYDHKYEVDGVEVLQIHFSGSC